MYPLVSVRSAQGNELERLNSGSISLLVSVPPTLPLLISRSHSWSYPICLGLLPFLSVFINVLLYLFCTCLINLHQRICTVGYPMNMMCCCKDYTQISPMRRITSLGDRKAKVENSLWMIHMLHSSLKKKTNTKKAKWLSIRNEDEMEKGWETRLRKQATATCLQTGCRRTGPVQLLPGYAPSC